jgi:hypothetical protein
MGGGRFDSDAYAGAVKTRRLTGTDDFDYDTKVRSGAVTGIHSDLDPKKVAGPTSPLAGKPIRESRDSDEHPESLPIVIIFDVTGSMGEIPRILQTKLVKLMDVVIAKAGIKDPQVLVGAVGDSYADRYPFQIGQFESDNRFDEQLRNIILEGNGGGQVKESYALAYRFAAYHTAIDSFEKRGKKGYLFTMGDEMPWPKVTVEEVSKIFGVQAEEDETVESLLEKAKERWEIFHLFSVDGSYPHRTDIHDRWRKLLGERFVMVEDSSLVCEVIAANIYSLETSYDADKVIGDIGLKGRDAATVKNALVRVSSGLPVNTAKGGLPVKHTKKGGGVSRI